MISFPNSNLNSKFILHHYKIERIIYINNINRLIYISKISNFIFFLKYQLLFYVCLLNVFLVNNLKKLVCIFISSPIQHIKPKQRLQKFTF